MKNLYFPKKKWWTENKIIYVRLFLLFLGVISMHYLTYWYINVIVIIFYDFLFVPLKEELINDLQGE